jgi:hypothetical protein
MHSIVWSSSCLLVLLSLDLSDGFLATPPPRSIPSLQKTSFLKASVTDPIVNGDEVTAASNIQSEETTTTKDATTTTSTEQHDPPRKEQMNDDEDDYDDDMSIFDIVAGRAAVCLFESELRCDAKGPDYSNMVSSNAVNWINDASAFALQKAFDRVKLKVGEEEKGRITQKKEESIYFWRTKKADKN